MKEPLRKYQPVIWATIEDALFAQEAERKGHTVVTVKNEEGYLVAVASHSRLFTLPKAA